MSFDGSIGLRALIVTAGSRACAIPVQYVGETMRPLPVTRMLGTPRFVRGLSIIRGEPVPVVDLRLLLENDESSAACDRFVTIKTGERRVALAVDTVVGLRDLDPTRTQELPPLLNNMNADLIEAIGRSDEELLFVLRATRLVPEEVWASLAAATQV